jgi:hypothetical protein
LIELIFSTATTATTPPAKIIKSAAITTHAAVAAWIKRIKCSVAIVLLPKMLGHHNVWIGRLAVHTLGLPIESALLDAAKAGAIAAHAAAAKWVKRLARHSAAPESPKAAHAAIAAHATVATHAAITAAVATHATAHERIKCAALYGKWVVPYLASKAAIPAANRSKWVARKSA